MSQPQTFPAAVAEYDTVGVHHIGGHLFDGLISMGGWKVIDDTGVSTVEIPHIRNGADLEGVDAVVVHGGFQFSDLWVGGRRLLTVFGRVGTGTHLIVAPSSYYFPNTDVDRLVGPCERVTFFAREKMSAHRLRVEGLPDSAAVVEDKCPSLYLADDDLPGGRRSGDYTLVALRDDKESVLPGAMRQSIVNRHAGGEDVLREDVCATAGGFEEAIAAVRGADRVVTDRLHTGVVAHIVGTPVDYYPTVSGKLVHMYDDYLADSPDVSLNYPVPTQKSKSRRG